MSQPRKAFWIGAFLLSGVVLLVGGVFVLARDNIFSRPVEYVVFFTGALDGLDIGADVTYRGVKVGNVRDIRLSYDRKINDVIMPVVIRISTETGTKKTTGPQLDRSIALLVERGLRAQLQTPSLVTGKAIVALDFFKGQEGYVREENDTGLSVIPTVPSKIDQAADVLRDLVEGFKTVPVKETLEAVNRTLLTVDALVSSPELAEGLANVNTLLSNLNNISVQLHADLPAIMGNLRESSAQVSEVLADVQAATESAKQALTDVAQLVDDGQRSLGPQSELQYELLQALQNMAQASKALQRTAESIEQQPQSLIFGKK